MKVPTVFAQLAEYPPQTTKRSFGFAVVFGAFGLFAVVLGGVLSLFVGSDAFLITGFIWKMVWNLMQIAAPLGLAVAAVNLHRELKSAFAVVQYMRLSGDTHIRREFWKWCVQSIGIVLMCTTVMIVATLGVGSTLFRAAGYDDAWFAMMTEEFFRGMGYISLFAAGIMLLYYIMHYLTTGGRMDTPR